MPLAAALNETDLPAHTAWLAGFKVTTGRLLTVIVALPEAVPVQLASDTDVTVYVTPPLEGLTSRLCGLVKTLLSVTPSDHTTVQGAAPVNVA